MRNYASIIKGGTVTKSDLIGLRKLINMYERRWKGLSVSRTAPKMPDEEVEELERTIKHMQPIVVGEWHTSGVELMRSPKNRKRLKLAGVLEIAESVEAFRLIGFERVGDWGLNAVAVYKAVGRGGRSFVFRNVPWQSGGQGVEVIEDWQ